MYSITLSLTLALDWGGLSTPRPFYPRKIYGTRFVGGWVGPRAGLDGCGKSRTQRDLISLLIKNPHTVQTVGSRCNDQANPAHS